MFHSTPISYAETLIAEAIALWGGTSERWLGDSTGAIIMGLLQAYAKDPNSTVNNGKNWQTEPHEIKSFILNGSSQQIKNSL